ncbi:MAG: ATP-binding protein [Chitinophagaceae bacterium]
MFIAGVVVIVLLQFLSGVSINRLIQGNKRLLNEVSIQNDLRKLESDVLTVESDIRGAIMNNDTSYLPLVSEKIDNIKSELYFLDKVLDEGNTAEKVQLLEALVHQKIDFSYQIINAYQAGGKDAGEAIITSGRGKTIRDSIVMVTAQLDSLRQSNLRQIIGSIERNGTNARTWGIILACIAGITILLTFLHVLKIGREQRRMIAELNRSERKIKESATIKEQFLANMSHEIRTPMNAILGFTNLLTKTPLDNSQAQYVDFIHSSGENLLTLINDILDLSKIEAGMMQLDNAPFSLNGLISSVDIMFRDKARQKGLQFGVHISPDIHDTLSGDAIRLTQVLINLLSNAVKFTEKGSVQLSVLPLKNTAEEVVLQFTIKDTGIGIAPEKKAAIFERFQQAEAATTRRFGGSGLGLSIVKQLVQIQKGTIDVESEWGKGAAFTVTLPFTPVYNYEMAYAVPAGDIDLTVKSINILIAEDNTMNQQLIRHLMKQWQLDYTLVSNGADAIEALKQQSYSLVLMDIQMPEMDGYAATLYIRNEMQLEVPIIAMTAHAMAGEKERCLSYGMNEYISKPIKETELYAMIEQFAQERQSTGTASPQSVINLQYLKDLSMGDTEFEHSIIRQFIVQVPEELQLLREAIEQQNLLQVKSLAHGMKSSVAYMGLTDRLHPYLQRMEAEATNGTEEPHFKDDFSQVEAICRQALAEAAALQVPV